MTDEVRKFYEYAVNGIHFIFEGDRELLEKIVAVWKRIKPFEQPDIILMLDDKVLAIEHFEFDASSSSRKGSLDKRKLAERNREFDKLIQNSDISSEPLVLTDSIDCLYSADNYIGNFKSVFEKHLAKVAEYKSHLISENIVRQVEDIIMCFFIIDSTPLGCYYQENDLKHFEAFQVRECLELISKAKEIDCFFFGSCVGGKNSLEFISNCPEVIEFIKEKIRIIDFSEDSFFVFEPHETRFCMKVNE